MTSPLARPRALARTGYGEDPMWERAADAALAELALTACDLLLVSTSAHFAPDLPELTQRLWTATSAPILFGAASQSILIDEVEREATPSVGILALQLPGAIISTTRISNQVLEHASDGRYFRERLNVLPEDVNGWIILADPFRFNTGRLVDLLSEGFPHAQIIGGLIAPDPTTRQASLLLYPDVISDGAIILGIGGPYAIFPVLSHGTDPIGDAWTITSTEGEWINTIANRPALELVEETLLRVPGDLRARTRANLLAGFVIDEYRLDYVRSDFVVRSITGIDQATGAIATGYHAQPGQTIQFQLRDQATADLDLTLALDGARLELTGRRPIAGFGQYSNVRGQAFFGAPHHDAALIRKKFPHVPILGLTTAAEIGPASGSTIVNTGSFALGILYDTI
ncbi:MAG TPA: FIST N-terminal domain-containing protein [Thermomicrobiales bacterium]|nr:FIST N-terminal domain-containing protein [Thermomicrobiales bacterium]